MPDEREYFTTARVKSKNVERVEKFGEYGDCFDDALSRVLDIAEKRAR